MGTFVGFDMDRLPLFATALSGDGKAATKLVGSVSDIVGDAAAALAAESKPATPHVGSTWTQSPVGLAQRLDLLSGSITRRLAHLKASEALAKAGFPVDPDAAFDDGPAPSVATVKAAIDAVRGLNGKDTGTNGNSDDLVSVVKLLEGLNPTEADAVVKSLSTEDLKRVNDMIRNHEHPWYEPWQHNGLSDWDWIDVTGALLSKVPPAQWKKLQDAFPGVQPPFDTTDGYLNGKSPQSNINASGLHWGIPTDPTFQDLNGDGKPDVSNHEIEQGGFSDCWYIASLSATTSADPDFVQQGLRQNPNGTISVRVFDHDGTAHWVTVTPDLPLGGDGHPYGAKGQYTDDNGVQSGPVVTWPSYYEKAFAVAYGDDNGGAPDGKDDDDRYNRTEKHSYGAIEWDYTDHAPPYVTGHDSQGIDNSFDAVAKAYNSGHPVIVASNSDDSNVAESQKGAYVTRHVYYVKDVKDGKLVLGNPWGGTAPNLVVTPDEFPKYFNSPRQLDIGG